MSQVTDYVIANASGATVRADINTTLLAVVSHNSGTSEPGVMYAFMLWVDTTTNLLKLRNAANNAWITLGVSITASNTVDINGGTIDGTTVGASSASTIVGTTVVANTSVNIAGDGATVTGIKDEDNMASNSAVKLATQQSIKAYVDAQIDTADTLAEILAIGNTTSGTDIETTTTDKVQFRDAAIYINSSADGQLDIVADTEIQIAATTIDVNGAMDVSGAITSSTGATITTADNTNTLSLISTDADAGVGPNLRLYRNSGSPADNDVTGVITFTGRNDNSQDVIYARQLSYISDASDGTEDGIFKTQTILAGTIRDMFNITPTEIVFNEDHQDLDFRVESDTVTHALFVQGSDGNVGIGNTSPSDFDTWQRQLVVGSGSGDTGITIYHGSGGGNQGAISFADGNTGTDRYRGVISYNGADEMKFSTAVTERMRIDSSGNLGIGCTPGTNVRLDIRSNAAATLGDFRNTSATGYGLYIAAGDTSSQYVFRAADYQNNALFSVMGDGNVGIGTSSPSAILTTDPEAGNFSATYNNYDGVGLFIRGNGTSSNGNYGPALAFGSCDSDSANQEHKHAAISIVQTGTDPNETGLAFWTHPTVTAADALAEKMRIDSSGNVGIGVTSLQANSTLEVNGRARFATGSEVLPALSSFSDLDTGIYFPGSNVLGMSTGGSERMRIDASGNTTISTGNLVIGTSGKGIDFSATSDGGVSTPSELLDDYEEGTWTPTWSGANSGGATYTRIGRVVYASGTFTATGSGTSGDCAGLPYTSTIDGSDGGGSGYHAQDTVTWSVLKISGAGFRFYTGSSQIQLENDNGTRFFLTYNI